MRSIFNKHPFCRISRQTSYLSVSHSIPLLLNNMKDKAEILSPQASINYLCCISPLHFPPTIKRNIQGNTQILWFAPISLYLLRIKPTKKKKKDKTTSREFKMQLLSAIAKTWSVIACSVSNSSCPTETWCFTLSYLCPCYSMSHSFPESLNKSLQQCTVFEWGGAALTFYLFQKTIRALNMRITSCSLNVCNLSKFRNENFTLSNPCTVVSWALVNS